MACEDSPIPSALQASGDLATTPQSASTSEETIIPPFWRHIESLLGEHRASLLALSGETQSEAGVIEPAPPIWRGASALRIEGAQLEGAPGATEQGSQEIVWESAPQPPIWPMAQSRGYSGLALASARLESEYDGAERASVHLIASPPPIWSSWFASAWPEAPSQPAIEDDQLPIWSSFLRQ